ncbi:MAG: hypothetical protein IT455_19885 [Planctomycetes bacterium]|nr:hypothetical protein [Planctomycetota bacterium]
MLRMLPSVLAAITLSLLSATAASQAPPATRGRVREEFGAANFVPADVAWFSSDLRLGEQVQLVQDSQAWREVRRLPVVTAGLSMLFLSPGWRQFQALRDDSAEIDAAVELLADAFSQEVFVCGDASWLPFVGQFAATYLESRMTQVTEGRTAGALQMIDGLIDIELPTTLIGCRLLEPARAEQLLHATVARLAAVVPAPIEQRQIGGGTFHVLRLATTMLPESVRDELRGGLVSLGMDQDAGTRFYRWFYGLRLALAVGLRDDYLMVSIGPDTRLLERLGVEGCLADAPALAPARAVVRPATTALVYVCPELSASQPMPRELADFVGGLCDGLPLPEGFRERLVGDLRLLLDELAAGYGPPRAELSVSCLNRGIESWSFVAAAPGASADARPLASLAHGGPRPLLVAARRAPPTLPDYLRFVHWLRVGYAYFTDYVAPPLRGAERRDFERFRAVFLPFLGELDAVIRGDLLPSLDGGETLLALDDAGSLVALPELRLPRPLRFPRPAIVQQLHDAARFERALRGGHRALGALLREAGGGRLPWPGLEGEVLDDGLCFAAAWPGTGLEPTALIAPERLVLACDRDAAHTLMAASPLPTADVVDLHAPASAVLHVDLARLLAMLADDVETLLDALRAEGRIDPEVHGRIRAHLPGLRRALGALRSYSSRTWTEGGLSVTHSWLQVEDITR